MSGQRHHTLSASPSQNRNVEQMYKAGATGLEPATSAVTGQRSNLLSYAPAICAGLRRGGSVPLQYAKARRQARSAAKLAARPAFD